VEKEREGGQGDIAKAKTLFSSKCAHVPFSAKTASTRPRRPRNGHKARKGKGGKGRKHDGEEKDGENGERQPSSTSLTSVAQLLTYPAERVTKTPFPLPKRPLPESLVSSFHQDSLFVTCELSPRDCRRFRQNSQANLRTRYLLSQPPLGVFEYDFFGRGRTDILGGCRSCEKLVAGFSMEIYEEAVYSRTNCPETREPQD
jgi:hypothetical protein